MFTVYLHAYTQPYGEDPVLSQAYYEITADIPETEADVENFFIQIANDFARQYREQLDDGVYGDFNWGDFIAEIPDWFLEENGVYPTRSAISADIQVFVDHDSHLLDYDYV